MTSLDKDATSTPRPAEQDADHGDNPLYTRYCAAPRPVHPVGEPRIVHSLLVATWLGRLIDPLPHHKGEKRARLTPRPRG